MKYIIILILILLFLSLIPYRYSCVIENFSFSFKLLFKNIPENILSKLKFKYNNRGEWKTLTMENNNYVLNLENENPPTSSFSINISSDDQDVLNYITKRKFNTNIGKINYLSQNEFSITLEKDTRDVILNIEGDESNNSVKIIGGWCQCSEGNRPSWKINEGANTVIAGGFKTNGNWGPCQSANNCTQYDIDALNGYTNKWLSVGGLNVGNSQSVNDCLSNAIELINKFNMNGIAFDMEGCLHDKYNDVKDWINRHKEEIRTNNPNFKFIYVPTGDNWVDLFNYNEDPDLFDYIAPMFYGGSDSYQTETYIKEHIINMIDLWTCDTNGCGQGYAGGANGKGVPKNKLLLTFQSQSAAKDDNGKEIIRTLSNKVKNEGYAGILGWEDIGNERKISNADSENMKIISSIIN